ncbi:MAG TPA: SDR family oxidoreductase [Leptospiraceae bacterium]|nr:SDR family oxidoreductase [Leptospiraceae bacterium]HNF24045.1 SDR family oxidoreductase [Leptospiraceae bacterium]HNI97481.1 SDR family oxidoreductase [Leptospiraceae bacterium]HNM04537.1 SDR family oxidoreductase [Leptospiraceae bacterium]HNN03958.1 SDR family oxidoreductase [Leptospiraceae bacterium]
MEEFYKDKVALITGAASPRGLGRAIANTIAAKGANIAVLDLNQEAIENAAEEISSAYGVKAVGIACNVTKEEDCTNAAAKIKESFGRLDFLVNNAGVLKDNLLMRMSEADWDLVVDVNLKGVFLMTKAASKLLLKSPAGRIVNISSVSGLTGQPAQANYSSSKAGVIALTKVSAREFSGRGVTVNAICPAFVQTDMTDALPEDVKKKLKEMTPLGNPITQSDVSYAVMFYISEGAKNITGTILRVDGGAAIGM